MMKIKKIIGAAILSTMLLGWNTYSVNAPTIKPIRLENPVLNHKISLIQEFISLEKDNEKNIDISYMNVLPSLIRSYTIDPMYINSMFNKTILTMDSIVNRKKNKRELAVDKILDSVTNYTAVVNRSFIKASIYKESNFYTDIVSIAGAASLMQIISDTWERFGYGAFHKNAFNPTLNVRAGVNYYLWMEKEFSEKNPHWHNYTLKEKQMQLLAGYNGGHNRLEKLNWDITRMYKETRNHVKAVIKKTEFFAREDNLKKLLESYILKDHSPTYYINDGPKYTVGQGLEYTINN